MKSGRRIPHNRKPRYCPNCGKPGMVKAGHKYGRQVWQCHHCKVRSIYPKLKPALGSL